MVLHSRRRLSSKQRGPQTVRRNAIVTLEDRSLDALFAKFEKEMSDVRTLAGALIEDQDDIAILRLVLEHEADTAAAVENLEEIVRWRTGAGKNIVEAASQAVKDATVGGSWDNDVVFAAAPHSDILGKFYTPSQYVVVNLRNGDLCCCIRASAVDSKSMMDEIGADDLTDFFFYAREVNQLVADVRTRRSGQLCQLVATNDFTGISGPPDSRFQAVLGNMSKKASRLWPGLAGPTVMLNLPGFIRWIINALLPLFPGAVLARIKFAKQRLGYLDDLSDLTSEPMRSKFVSDIEGVLAE